MVPLASCPWSRFSLACLVALFVAAFALSGCGGSSSSGTSAPVAPTAPVLSLSSTSLQFGSVTTGTTSAAQSITATNTGNAVLNVSSIIVTGSGAAYFNNTSNCGSTLPAGASCTVAVTFTPTIAGALTANVSIADNAANTPQTVSLSGTGVAPGTPALTLSSSSLTFASTALGSSAAAQTVTLTNSGTAALAISSIALGGSGASSFTLTSTCGNSVAVAATCTLSIGFAPASLGALTASVVVTDNAAGSPQTIALSGTGAAAPAAVLTLSTGGLTFPATAQGSTAPVQAVTLTNTGNASLTIAGISLTGTNASSYSQTSTCGSTLAASASCAIMTSFTPASTGTLTASIVVTPSGNFAPQSISLTGTGTAAPAPVATFSSTSLTFASTAQGSTAAAQSVTLTNTGNASLAISGITLTGPNASSFTQTSTCGSTLAASASCAISASFAPAATGTLTASIVVATNAAGSPQSLTLTGTGTAAPTPSASFNNSSLTFASTVQGVASTSQSVTLSNIGNAALTISGVTLTGANASSFSQTNTCGSSLAIGANCTVSITFIPAATGSLTATLSVADNAVGSPQTVSLSGTGAATAPAITFLPTSLSFGTVGTSATSSAQTVKVTNSGMATLNLTTVAVAGTNAASFGESSNCGATLAPNASCTLSVTFAPTAGGALAGNVVFTDNVTGSPQTVALAGTGSAPASQGTFTNPIIANGADPSVVFVNGVYYAARSGCAKAGSVPAICILSATTLPGLNGTAVPIYTPPSTGPNSQEIYAPQVVYVPTSVNGTGNWFVYYAADPDGLNDHTLFAITPVVANQPLGQWQVANTGNPSGAIVTDWKSTWAIDPDVFQASDGNYYLTYSCRQDNSGTSTGNAQSICIAGMSDPLHLKADPQTGKNVIQLSQPTQYWERRTFPTQEGPFGFTHNGIDYILYSGSYSGTSDDYAQGLLINTHPPQASSASNSITNPADWTKQGPVFDGHNASYGTASSVLVPSPDGTELWNVYHGTNCINGCAISNGNTWQDRSVRTQKAGWSANGSLVMGYPVDFLNTDQTGRNVPLQIPSQNGTGTTVVPFWGAAFGDAAEGDYTDGLVVGSWTNATASTISSTGLDANQSNQNFFGSNPNLENYVVTTQVQWVASGTTQVGPKYGIYAAYVDHNNYYTAMIDLYSCAAPGCLVTDALVAGVDKPATCPLPASFVATAANTLTVTAVNGLFTVSVNGAALTGACQSRTVSLVGGQETRHGTNGQAGVIVRNTEANYINFSVSPGVPVDSTTYGLTYAFRNQGSQLSLDNSCDGGCGATSPTNGTAIIQYAPYATYPLNTGVRQVWSLNVQSDGSFTMVNALSGLCLDDPYGNTTPSRTLPQAQGTSTMLWQQPCNGKANQNWVFVPVPDGTGSFYIQSAVSSLVIDGFDTSQNTQSYLNTNTGAASQKWQLIPQ